MAARRMEEGGLVPHGSGTQGAVPGVVGPSVPYVALSSGAGCGGGSKEMDSDVAWLFVVLPSHPQALLPLITGPYSSPQPPIQIPLSLSAPCPRLSCSLSPYVGPQPHIRPPRPPLPCAHKPRMPAAHPTHVAAAVGSRAARL